MTLNQFIYKATRPLGGLQLARILARHHPRILMYHRLSATDEPGKIHVDQFRKQMRLIKRHFHPMNLTELLEAHEQGNVPNHAVVVTFDDGYADFAEYAFPIMQEEGVQSTLFITTGFVNGDLWLWPDQIRYLVDSVDFLNGFSFNGVSIIDSSDFPCKAWNKISDYCLTVSNKEKLHLIDDLFRQASLEKPIIPPNQYRAVSWAQLREMNKQGLEIGSHSYSHPVMTKLNEESLIDELKESKKLILENLGINTEVFCYPNGQISDFNDQIKCQLRRQEYKFAVAAYPARYPLSDLSAINRYPASNAIHIFEKHIYGLTFLSMI